MVHLIYTISAHIATALQCFIAQLHTTMHILAFCQNFPSKNIRFTIWNKEVEGIRRNASDIYYSRRYDSDISYIIYLNAIIRRTDLAHYDVIICLGNYLQLTRGNEIHVKTDNKVCFQYVIALVFALFLVEIWKPCKLSWTKFVSIFVWLWGEYLFT